MSRTKRSAASFGTLLLLPIISTSIGIFSTPLLLQWLGNERYGAFRAAIDVAAYLLLMELGIGGALCSMLARAVSSGDRDQVLMTLGVGIRAYLKVLAGMAATGIVLLWMVPTILSVQGAIALELQIGFSIGLLSVIFIPLGAFQLLIDASQRSYVKNILLVIQSILVTGLSLCFAWLNFGIPGQFLSIFIGTALFNLAITWDGTRRYPQVWSAIVHPSDSELLEQQLWKLNIPNLVVHLSGRVGLMTDTIIVSYFLGPSMVVPFVITQRLASLAQGQLQGISMSTWAVLAEFDARKSYAEFNHHLINLTRLSVVLGLTILIPIAAYNVHFITLWMGAERFGGWGVTLLVACNSLMRGVMYLCEWCFTGTGNFARIVPFAVVGAIVNLGVSLVATHYLGIVGPLLGTFASLVFVSSWWMPKLLHKSFGTSPRQLIYEVTRPLAIGIPYGAIVIWIAVHHKPWGWLGLMSEMTCVAFVFLILMWNLVLTLDEQTQWKHRITMLVPNFKAQPR